MNDDIQTRFGHLIDTLHADIRSGNRRGHLAEQAELLQALPTLLQPEGPQPMLALRAVRILANLYDSRGKHVTAKACLDLLRGNGELDRIRELVKQRDLPWPKDRAFFKEQLLVLAEDNTSLLRHGARGLAEIWTANLLNSLAGDQSDETTEVRIRANHLMGRILQTSGRPTESEPYFAAALEQCQFWMEHTADEGNAAYARYQAGIALTGLARSAIDQGSLSKAYRQLLIAKMFLAKSPDRITIAYAEFLTGCCERQTHKLDLACARLKKACETFLEEDHLRLYHRCSLELAQAYYNDGKIAESENTLTAFDKPADVDIDDARDELTRQRWGGTRKLLEARIKLLSDPQSAEKYAQSGLNELRENWTDQKAIAHAILAEAALIQKKYPAAIQQANSGLTARNGHEPVDVVDRAWLLIVLAKAHLGRNEGGDLYNAQRCVERCRALPLENEMFKRRRAEVIQELDSVGSFYISHHENDLDYHHWDARLKRFLFERVRERLPGAKPEEYAERLGISRASYYKWVDAFRQP